MDGPRLPYREQLKEGDAEANRGSDGKTTSKSGLALDGISNCRKLRTARSGGSWLNEDEEYPLWWLEFKLTTVGNFPGSTIPVTYKKALQWLPASRLAL